MPVTYARSTKTRVQAVTVHGRSHLNVESDTTHTDVEATCTGLASCQHYHPVCGVEVSPSGARTAGNPPHRYRSESLSGPSAAQTTLFMTRRSKMYLALGVIFSGWRFCATDNSTGNPNLGNGRESDAMDEVHSRYRVHGRPRT